MGPLPQHATVPVPVYPTVPLHLQPVDSLSYGAWDP